jgi:hypothetical protein
MGRDSIRRFGWLPAAVATLVLTHTSAPLAQAPTGAALPARFDRYLSTVVRATLRDRSRLLAGEPVTKLLDTGDVSEVGVFGAVWIRTSPQRYVEAVSDIETFERGGAFHITKRVSVPPRLDDFAALTLPLIDVRDLRNCRVGDCKLKLDRASLEAIRARVDFTKPTAQHDIDTVMRESLLHVATAYGETGNTELPIYQDGTPPMAVAREFDAMVARMPEFTEWIADPRPHFLAPLAPALPGVLDFLYWQDVSFGLKPTIRMSHVVSYDGPSGTVVASKMIYATHYFRSALEVRVLVPDPARGPGFWFVMVNRTRLDGLTGLIGFLVRGHVRGEVQKGALGVLAATKRKLELEEGLER